jgi:hypothetical protein
MTSLLGAAYRWSALSAMVGFQVSDSWFIGMHMIWKPHDLLILIQDHMKYFFVTKYSKVITKSHHLDSSNLI